MQANLASGAAIGNVKILVSDTKQHSVQDWANATAEQIFDLSDLVGDRLLEAEKIRIKIANALMPSFQVVIDQERQGIAISLLEVIGAMLKDIQMFDWHPWSEKLASLAWIEAATVVIGNNLATLIDIERRS